jgi:ubiquinone/menaquinone biosynthesis C-methylase UbiE
MNQNKYYEKKFFDSLAVSGKDRTLNSRDLEHLEFIINKIKLTNINFSGNILECGCGTGEYGKNILKNFGGITITGVDISDKSVSMANDGTKNYSAIVGDIEYRGLFMANSFNSILCLFILHHFPDLLNVFENLHSWLKKDGTMIILEPNGDDLINKASKVIRKGVELIFGQDYIVNKGLGTPNETDHPLKEYLHQTDKLGMDVIYKGYAPFHLKNKDIKDIRIFFKKILAFILPESKYAGKGNLMLILKK